MREIYWLFLITVFIYILYLWVDQGRAKRSLHPQSKNLKKIISSNISSSENFTQLSATKEWLDSNEYMLSPNDYFSLCEQYTLKETLLERKLSKSQKTDIGKIQ